MKNMQNNNLTLQDSLFPLTRSFEPNETPSSTHQFVIEDDILYNCIAFGEPITDMGGLTESKSNLGAALLTYFTARALNIHRMPFCADRIYSKFSDYDLQQPNLKKKILSIFNQLNESRIVAICDELERLYLHTQEQLRKKNLTHVHLKRVISVSNDERPTGSYAAKLAELRYAADAAGVENVDIEMDTINSFSDEAGAYEFRSAVLLYMTVPIEDVLFCHNLIKNRVKNLGHTETREWVILNRSSTGVVSIPASSIQPNDKQWKTIPSFTRETALRYFKDYDPIILRPLNRKARRSNHSIRMRPTVLQRIINLLS